MHDGHIQVCTSYMYVYMHTYLLIFLLTPQTIPCHLDLDPNL